MSRTENLVTMSKNKELRTEYFHWLVSITGIAPDNSESSYHLLLKKLHERDFYSIVPNDDNRGEDGKKLRKEFADEANYHVDTILDMLESPCSMLEMMIALSIRCQEIMSDLDDNFTVSKWFWEMISNVGLIEMDDDHYVDMGGSDEFRKIIDIILDRKYDKNGNGGLFPLKYPGKNQRKQELVYQMNAYLMENYYIPEKDYV